MTELTDVEIKKISADVGALKASAAARTDVDALKMEVERHTKCTAEGMLFDKVSDGCILSKMVTCGPIPLPKDSGRVNRGCTSLYPLKCDTECPAGYKGSQGKITSECGADGKWSIISDHKNADPKCNDVDECAANPCKDQTYTCINKPGSYECACGASIDNDGACKRFGEKKATFDGSGRDVTFVVPGATNGQYVTYRIDVKGSGGQGKQYDGGNGGFATGTFKIKSGTKLILAVGGPNKGRGFGRQTSTTYMGNGGGLSGVFVDSVAFENTVLIAGSGGGSGDNRARRGGHGGGNGDNPNAEPNGPYVHGSMKVSLGKGATTTSGGAAGSLRGGGNRGKYGNKLKGGDSHDHGAGGGAGYYGGGGGSHYGGLCGCSGGGGSSFLQKDSIQDGAVQYVSGMKFSGVGAPGETGRTRGNHKHGATIIFTPVY